MTESTFPSPFEIETPAGAEGWEQMYNWYHLFGEERRELDEQRFWFADRLHHPDVIHPYDEIQCECWWQALGAFNTRIFSMPPGVRGRPAHPQRPALRHAGPAAGGGHPGPRGASSRSARSHYYENWDVDLRGVEGEGHRQARRDPRDRLRPAAATSSRSKPSSSTSGIARASGWCATSSARPTMYETYQYHFELLNIGYAAYLNFFQLCKTAFPGIGDQSIARMVGGLQRRPLPARRRAAPAGQGGRAAGHRRDSARRVADRRRAVRAALRRPRRQGLGRRLDTRPPTRGSSSTPTPGTPAAITPTTPGPTSRTCRWCRCGSTCAASAPARTSTATRRACCASATASPPSTAS